MFRDLGGPDGAPGDACLQGGCVIWELAHRHILWRAVRSPKVAGKCGASVLVGTSEGSEVSEPSSRRRRCSARAAL